MTNQERLFVALVEVVALAGIGAGCAHRENMQAASGVPAAQGTVTATKDSDGNTDLVVDVKHLARPDMVTAGATVYLVWIDPAGGKMESVGILNLGSNLEGILKTKTPQRKFALAITPEANAQVERPAHAPVFTANVDRGD
ncbi:MAG: hypothetical protein ABSB49_02600 [Polyangia bacterium]|jgi:hypothetical protein